MDKENIEKLVSKIIKKKTSLSLKKIKNDDDLYTNQLLDSFDVINIIKEIEDYYDIEIKVEKIKKFKFSIKFLSEYINKKIK